MRALMILSFILLDDLLLFLPYIDFIFLIDCCDWLYLLSYLIILFVKLLLNIVLHGTNFQSRCLWMMFFQWLLRDLAVGSRGRLNHLQIFYDVLQWSFDTNHLDWCLLAFDLPLRFCVALFNDLSADLCYSGGV